MGLWVGKTIGICQEKFLTLWTGVVDDFLLFAPDKTTLWAWHEAIISRLARLRLTIHPGAQVHAVNEGLPFLGFVVYPDQRRLKRRKGIYYRQRLRALMRDYAQENLSFDQLTASVRGWVNHVRYGNTIGLRKAILTRQMIPPPIKYNRYE